MLAEQYLSYIQQNGGFTTQKPITLQGSAGLDMSASTGSFKFPKGAASGQVQNTISGQGATRTLLASESGSSVLFDRAAGIIYTLPAPVVGLYFEFTVTVSVTSNNAKVITDAGTTLLIGSVWDAVAAGTGTTFIGNGTTHIAVLQNGTTTGGLIGTNLIFTCVSATLWEVQGVTLGSGTVATPFSTT